MGQGKPPKRTCARKDLPAGTGETAASSNGATTDLPTGTEATASNSNGARTDLPAGTEATASNSNGARTDLPAGTGATASNSNGARTDLPAGTGATASNSNGAVPTEHPEEEEKDEEHEPAGPVRRAVAEEARAAAKQAKMARAQVGLRIILQNPGLETCRPNMGANFWENFAQLTLHLVIQISKDPNYCAGYLAQAFIMSFTHRHPNNYVIM